MKKVLTKSEKIVAFFQNLLGIKPSNGIKKLKKKFGIVELVEKKTDFMKFRTKDGGFIEVERLDTKNDYSAKATELRVKKVGGEFGLNGGKLGEFNTVEHFTRSRNITDRSYTDYSADPIREVKIPHIEEWNAPFCKGHFTLDYKSTPLSKSAYERHGYTSGSLKI